MIVRDSPVAQMLDSGDTSRQVGGAPSPAQDLGMNQKTDPSIQPTSHKTLTVKILPCKRKPEASEQGNNSNHTNVSFHNEPLQSSPVSDRADLSLKDKHFEGLGHTLARKEKKKKSSRHHHRTHISVRNEYFPKESRFKESEQIEAQLKQQKNPKESQLKQWTKPNAKHDTSVLRFSNHDDDASSKHGSAYHDNKNLSVSPTQRKVDPLQGLRSYIETLGGSLEGGWKAEQGKLCKIYLSPTNRKFNARTQVARYLGLPLHHRKNGEKVKHENGHISNETEHESTIAKSKENDEKSLEDSEFDGHNHPDQSIASIYEGSSEKLNHVQIFKSYIEGLGGSLEEGWRVEPHKTYNTYYAPNGKKFTARTQVARYLGLLSLFRRKKTKMRNRRGNRRIKSILADKHSGCAKYASDNIYNKANKAPRCNTEHISMNLEGQDCIKRSQNADSAEVHLQTRENAATSMNLTPIDGNIRGDMQLSKHESLPGALITERCQDVFQSIISADKFASLGNMLSRALPCGYSGDGSQFKNSTLFSSPLGLQLISFRLSTGAYGKSPELFAEDIQQVWSDIAAIGNNLVSMATSLSKLSDSLYKEQVSSLFQIESKEKAAGSNKYLTSETMIVTEKLEEKRDPSQTKSKANALNNITTNAVCRACGKVGNADSYICRKCNDLYHMCCATCTTDLSMTEKWCCPSCISSPETHGAIADQEMNGFELVLPSTTTLSNDESSETNREQTCKTSVNESICKACGKDDGLVLLCDSCDAAYHMNCVIPPINNVPDGFWYCPICEAEAKKKKSTEKRVDKKEHHCVVCERIHTESLGVPFGEENLDRIQSESVAPFGRETLENAPIYNRSVEVSVASSSAKDQDHNALKIESSCKLCGISDENGAVHCSACRKCYHLSCLRPALRSVISPGVWYCPSCLCCECRIDVDDDKILLCDGCDEGYHMYCLSPPVKKIPRGLWFCATCTSTSRNRVRKDDNGLVISPNNSKKVSKGKRKYSELNQANGVAYERDSNS